MRGLVLEGGGAKGAFHIGAYKALTEMGIEINAVAGTSIGALNGAMIVQGDVDKAYKLWYNIKPAKVFNINEKYMQEIKNFDINKNNIKYLLQKAKQIMSNRGLDIKLIKQILRDNIKEDEIRKSNIEFGIITISLSDMKPMELFIENIPQGKLVDYLLASANLPAFKIEKLDGKLFIDGGFYDNLPIKLLTSKGYKEIIVIRTFGMGRTRDVNKKELNLTYINPSEDLGRILNFEQKKARKNLKLGYYDTLKKFKGLKGQRYYINSVNKEKFYIDFLLSLKKENIDKVAKLLGCKNTPCKRALFEYIIPRLLELMDIKRESDYQDLVIYFYEKLAEKNNIERFKIYSFREFTERVRENFDHQKYNNHYIPDFIKKSDILSRTIKEKLVDEIIYNLLLDKLT